MTYNVFSGFSGTLNPTQSTLNPTQSISQSTRVNSLSLVLMNIPHGKPPAEQRDDPVVPGVHAA